MFLFPPVLILGAFAAFFAAPAWDGQQVLSGWLATHGHYRVATDEDCACPNELRRIRAGYGGDWGPAPDYQPYAVTGDFNGDGVDDFAAVVMDRSGATRNFALVIFNGPLRAGTTSPSYFKRGLDLKGNGLFYGPPRPKPHRLLLGPFQSDGVVFSPHGRSYRVR